MIKQRGFTLVELMIAVAILAVVSAVGFTSFSQSQVRGRDARRKSDLRSIAVALELYYQKNKNYPCSSSYAISNSANWITDECSTATPKPTLATNYISEVPTDPLKSPDDNNFNPDYAYGYFAPTWCQPQGQLYILIAHLENSKDPDTYANRLTAGRPYKQCDGNLFDPNFYGNDSYIITSY